MTVIVEGAEPVMALDDSARAVLTDQQGSYVYVVDAEKHAQQRPHHSSANPRRRRR